MGVVGRIATALLACAVLGWCADAAAMRKVDPGERVELKSNEGLLVVAIDSSGELASVNLRRNGSLFGGGRLGKLPSGQTLQLFVAEEGNYRWDGVRWWGGMRFDLEDDEGYDFDVRSGRINYPGDLVFRTVGFLTATLPVVNRSLRAIDWLHATHPEAARALPFEFVGAYPDEFPQFLLAHERGRTAPAALPKAKAGEPLDASTLDLPVDVLWRAPRIRELAMDQGGAVLAELATTEEGRWVVDLFDLEHERVVRVLDSGFELTELHWAGPRTLLVTMGSSHLMRAVFVLHLWDASLGKDQKPEVERFQIPRPGSIVDPLFHDPDHILFATHVRGKLSVHRMDISSLEAAADTSFRRSKRLNTGVDEDRLWLTDARGNLRLALAAPGGEWAMMHGTDGAFSKVLDGDMLARFEPMRLSADGWTLYGISEHEREQRELVAIDLRAPERMTTVFARPGVDVLAPVFAPTGDLVGAAFRHGGMLAIEYFDEADRALTERLEARFPGRSVFVLGRDAARGHYVVGVDAADAPWRVYHYDAGEQRASLLDHGMPWLKGKRLHGNVLVKAAAKDGKPIDAFLTLPENPLLAPLVVMPHGGPIGVSDSRHYNPDVQFLASLGYAVLQVNFRGSEGYGRAFREAGMGELGGAIEDDIQAAVDAALAAHPLDASRICAVGASYGGYSAMMLAIRWPERYDCVVAEAAPSDLALLLSASDASWREVDREATRKLLGDTDDNGARLRERSPLYRYRELRAPLLLIHGGEDRRVDYEHARRMQRMLALDGRPPEVIELTSEGHGIATMESLDFVSRYLGGFLQRHLRAPGHASR